MVGTRTRLASAAGLAIAGALLAAPAGAAKDGGTPPSDLIAVEGCGTVTTLPVFGINGVPFGACRVWIPDPGKGGFSGVSVTGAFLDAYAEGARIHNDGFALLAQTNVFPGCPGLPLVTGTIDDCAAFGTPLPSQTFRAQPDACTFQSSSTCNGAPPLLLFGGLFAP